ncbi:MAG: hypothetical protein M3Z14_05230 [Candidatus Eremiobacteraeota bacterium]|nr:hypothetical protein [Candidatus Eremiobacteraeota bacterium]
MALSLLLMLIGCREVRVRTYAQGTTTVPGANAVVVVRGRSNLESLGIRARSVRFTREFGVLLLMGPHREVGWHQVIESIRANQDRVRVVAFEEAPLDGGAPSREYRTYTLWIIPNSVYRRGSHIDVVTPSGNPIAATVLR